MEWENVKPVRRERTMTKEEFIEKVNERLVSEGSPALNAFDLIIISRKVHKKHYEQTGQAVFLSSGEVF